MTQKLFCLCAAVVVLVVFATANVASAQEVVAAPAACPCTLTLTPCAPCKFIAPACPPVVGYRIGPFGAIRPVVYTAPVVRVTPVVRVPVYRPVYVPRYHRTIALPPYYAW